MLDLVGTREDRFPHDEAYLVLNILPDRLQSSMNKQCNLDQTEHSMILSDVGLHYLQIRKKNVLRHWVYTV